MRRTRSRLLTFGRRLSNKTRAKRKLASNGSGTSLIELGHSYLADSK